MTAMLTPARSISGWLTTSPRQRFDIPTTQAMLAALVARADRRPMPYCRSVSLGEILGDVHAVEPRDETGADHDVRECRVRGGGLSVRVA